MCRIGPRRVRAPLKELKIKVKRPRPPSYLIILKQIQKYFVALLFFLSKIVASSLSFYSVYLSLILHFFSFFFLSLFSLSLSLYLPDYIFLYLILTHSLFLFSPSFNLLSSLHYLNIRFIPQETVDNKFGPDCEAGLKALDPNQCTQPTL